MCTAEYQAVRDGTGGSVLRSYAGTNPGEFFAVATETFFTRPIVVQDAKPALYDVLAAFYRQDPAARACELSSRTGPIGPVRKDRTRSRPSARRPARA